MKKYLFIILVGMLFTSCSTTTEKETRNLDSFDKINVVGNVELHLEKNSDHSMEVMAKNTSALANLITEVRNGELYVYTKKDGANWKNPKYVIYINHSGISDITMTGAITLRSDDDINTKDLAINGRGVLKGNLEVAVNTLSVDLKGVSTMYISGYANTANLEVSGIGFMNAGSLETKNGKDNSRGIALIHK